MNQAINNIYAQRIHQLQAKMKKSDIDACIIPTSDPHISEYLPEHWQERRWISGFTGSAGTVMVTQNFAGLWTDSRYWEQAQRQLSDTGISLQKMTTRQNTHVQWLAENIPPHGTVAVNAAIISVTDKMLLEEVFFSKQIKLVVSENPLADLWQDRPALPGNLIYEHQQVFCGLRCTEKIHRIRQKMDELGAHAHIVSALDDIAWITNLRGNDVDFNPVFLAYLFIDQKQATL